jgi:hypothetical protein
MSALLVLGYSLMFFQASQVMSSPSHTRNLQTSCEGGQVWNTCGSPCTRTCNDPNPVCIQRCDRGCECPADKPIWHNGECVTEESCSAPTLCFVARPLVADEGRTVGQAITPLSGGHWVQSCEERCATTPGCNSFALCETGPSGCWMKDKVVTASSLSGTQARGCKTYYPYENTRRLEDVNSNEIVV